MKRIIAVPGGRGNHIAHAYTWSAERQEWVPTRLDGERCFLGEPCTSVRRLPVSDQRPRCPDCLEPGMGPTQEDMKGQDAAESPTVAARLAERGGERPPAPAEPPAPASGPPAKPTAACVISPSPRRTWLIRWHPAGFGMEAVFRSAVEAREAKDAVQALRWLTATSDLVILSVEEERHG